MDNLPWLTRYTCGKEIHITIIYDLVYEYNVDVCIDHLKFLIRDYIGKPCIIMFSYCGHLSCLNCGKETALRGDTIHAMFTDCKLLLLLLSQDRD